MCIRWEATAESLQQAANINDLKTFYRELHRGVCLVKTLDRNSALLRKSDILNRFADNFQQLFTVPIPEARDFGLIQQKLEVLLLYEAPDLQEVIDAIDMIQEGNAPGKCGSSADISEHSGTDYTGLSCKFGSKTYPCSP